MKEIEDFVMQEANDAVHNLAELVKEQAATIRELKRIVAAMETKASTTSDNG